MGCCCSSNDARHPSELNQPLLQAQPDFDASSLAVTVQLKGCKGIPTDGFINPSPYLKFSLTCDPDKKEKSSVKSRTREPVWAPSELFEFMPVTEEQIESSRLIVSLFNRKLIGKDKHIGDGIAKLSSLEKRDNFSAFRVSLVDKDGEPIQGTTVNIDLKIGCAFIAYGTEEEYLYEYERWDLIRGWSSEHLLATDPGRWSDNSMEKWGESFEELQLELGKGWKVQEDWRITARPGSGMAWEYAVGFRFPSWFDKQNSAVRVRRRLWRRVIVNTKYSQHLVKKEGEGGKGVEGET